MHGESGNWDRHDIAGIGPNHAVGGPPPDPPKVLPEATISWL